MGKRKPNLAKIRRTITDKPVKHYQKSYAQGEDQLSYADCGCISNRVYGFALTKCAEHRTTRSLTGRKRDFNA